LATLDREGLPTSATAYGQVNNWINDAIREVICARHNWIGMEERAERYTSANTDAYGYPSSLTKDISTIFIRPSSTADFVPLEEMTALQARYEFRESQATGQPVAWFRFSDGIRLRPTPDAAYLIAMDYWDLPAELTDDNQTNSFTTRFPRLVSLWATVFGLEFFGEINAATRMRQLAESDLGTAISDNLNIARPRNAVVTPSRASGVPVGNRRSWRRVNLGL
jgi:hypothetical protein